MPIATQCPHCQKKFRAPDSLAGKSVKCPACEGALRVPAAEPVPAQDAGQPGATSASWYILTENREQMGPVTKEQLDNLATQGRLSFCQVRRGDWRSWKWADDLYPDLPPHEAKGKGDEPAPRPPVADDQDPARLVLCPDCGNTVSRRATLCPHCGCPAAVLLGQVARAKDGPVAPAPPPPGAAPGAAPEASGDTVASSPSRRWHRYAITAGVLVAILAVAVPLYQWWRTLSAVQQAVEQVVTPAPPAPIPQPEEPAEVMLSPEEKNSAIDNASRKMAEHIDTIQRQFHLPLSMIGQTVESVEMLQALAGGNLDAIPESTSAVPGGKGIEPYKSQVEQLFGECRDWVRKNVKRGACTSGDVWTTAQAWAKEKQAAVLAPLGGEIPVDLSPAPIPEGP
ncbi:MAG: hypothetical protein ACYC6Y_29915 [Thermoguttaceae bacterium]